jgi:hypothetical protein
MSDASDDWERHQSTTPEEAVEQVKEASDAAPLEGEKEEETSGVPLSQRIGAAIGSVAVAVGTSLSFILYGVTYAMPWGSNVWRWLAKRSLTWYQKTARASAISVHTKEHKAHLRPVDLQSEDIENNQKAGWKVRGTDRVFQPSGEGPLRLGGADVIWLDDDYPGEVASWQARMSQALDFGQKYQVFRDADLAIEQEIVYHHHGEGGNGQAVADGGQATEGRWHEHVTVSNPGQWERTLIDIGSGDGYSGMAVDPQKAKEVMREQISTDDLDRAEQRGWLAGLLDDQDVGSLMLKLFLIAAVVAIAGLVGPEIVASLFGDVSGGGGGGGGISLPTLSITASSLLGGI